MTRRVLGLSTDTWRLVAAAAAVAAWWLVFVTHPAFANDCIDYVKNPKNFATIPKGLIEDCMRTGYVQAAATAAAAVATATAIAAGVTKALGGGGTDKTSVGVALGGTVTAGGGDGTGGDGGGDPNKPPEGPGGQQTRDSVPAACQVIWDSLQQAIDSVKNVEQGIEETQKDLDKAIWNKQNNLMKVTIQLGSDAAQAAAAGAGGIKGAMGIATGLADAPELVNAIASAASRADGFGKAIANVLEEIQTLTGNAGRFAAAVEEAGALSAEAESKIGALVMEEAQIGTDLDKFQDMAKFAQSVDSTLREQQILANSIEASEQSLADAEETNRGLGQRQQEMDEWAASERQRISDEDTEAFRKKHDELATAREKIDGMRARNADAAKAAHDEWQAKMDEMRAAKKELDEARNAAVDLRKARADFAKAKLDLDAATNAEEGAALHLQDAESDLNTFDEADRAKWGDTRGNRLTAAESALEDAKAAGAEALQNKRAAQDALDAFNAKLDNREPDFWKMSGDDLGEREGLANTYGGAEAEATRTRKELDDWFAKNPGAPSAPDDLSSSWKTAENNRLQAAKDLREFDWRMDAEGKSAQFTPQERAEYNRLKAARDEAAAAAAPSQAAIDDARAQVSLANTPTDNELAKGARAGSERSRLKQKLDDARQQLDHARSLKDDAQKRVDAGPAAISDADTTGTGEPAGKAETIDFAQDKYNNLIKEQEALRVKYENLASGAAGNEAEAAALRQRISELEGELSNVKDRDWQVEAARSDPQKYAEYQATRPERLAESQAKVNELTSKVNELHMQADQVQQQLSELQAQTGGQSSAEIEAKLNELRAALAAKQGEEAAARTTLQTNTAAKATAQSSYDTTEAKLKAAEAKKQDLENQKRGADADLEAVKAKQRQDFNDVSTAGKVLGPLYGDKGDWTPYKGSGAEDLANQSHSARQKWDDNYDATHPQWYKDLNDKIKAPFKWVGKEVSDGFNWAFVGHNQSPDEIAAILKNDVETVQRLSDQLKGLQEQYDKRIATAKERRNDLDTCCRNNNA